MTTVPGKKIKMHCSPVNYMAHSIEENDIGQDNLGAIRKNGAIVGQSDILTQRTGDRALATWNIWRKDHCPGSEVEQKDTLQLRDAQCLHDLRDGVERIVCRDECCALRGVIEQALELRGCNSIRDTRQTGKIGSCGSIRRQSEDCVDLVDCGTADYDVLHMKSVMFTMSRQKVHA